MSSYLWPNEDGWPYPDAEAEVPDVESDIDDDAMLLKTRGTHLLDTLDPLEQQVVRAHYGLDGGPPRSMKQLHSDLGLSRARVREVLAGGLAKLRLNLNT